MDFVTFPLDPELLPKWFSNPPSRPNKGRSNHLFRVSASGIEGAGDGLFTNCDIPPFALLEEYSGTIYAETLIGTCTRRHTLSTRLECYIIELEQKNLTFMVPQNYVGSDGQLNRRVYLKKQDWKSEWQVLLSENLFRTEMHVGDQKDTYKEINYIEEDPSPILVSTTILCDIFLCPYIWENHQAIPCCWPMFANDVFVAKSFNHFGAWEQICEKSTVGEAKRYVLEKENQWNLKARQKSKLYDFLSFSGCANAKLLKLTFDPNDHPSLHLKESVTRIFLLSLGMILKGQEVTVDYGYEHWLQGSDFWDLNKHRILHHIHFVNLIIEQIGLPGEIQTSGNKRKREAKTILDEVDIPKTRIPLFKNDQSGKYVCVQWTHDLSLVRSLGILSQFTTTKQLCNPQKIPEMVWLILLDKEYDLQDTSLHSHTALFSYFIRPMTIITNSRLIYDKSLSQFRVETTVVKKERSLEVFTPVSLPSSTSFSPSMISIKQEPLNDLVPDKEIEIFVPTMEDQKRSIFLQSFKKWLRKEKSKSGNKPLSRSSVQRYVSCAKSILQLFIVKDVQRLPVEEVVPKNQWKDDKRARYNACVKLKEYLNAIDLK
jgi:hypothetical protein